MRDLLSTLENHSCVMRYATSKKVSKKASNEAEIRNKMAASFAATPHPIPRQRPVIRLQAKLKKTQVWLQRVTLPVDGGIRKDGSAQSIFENTRVRTRGTSAGGMQGSLLPAGPALRKGS